ncbi:MAG TPA: sigma 54-interacting transcriptional regulator [Candidatus Angelobacter sp.]|nr:sigma 54-interacting transcriptional regulator [Candidatus Angelobacter sp.]
MSTDTRIPVETPLQHYEAVLRISEAISACGDPAELVKQLSGILGEFLYFNHMYLAVCREGSKEIEFLEFGRTPLSLPFTPIEELPGWESSDSHQPLYIPDWNTEQRFARFREEAKKMNIRLGSTIGVPLTTPHRRLGAFGIVSDQVTSYSQEDIGFLRLIGRVVAFAIDDGLQLRRAQAAQASLRQQNDRLQLLLNLTNRITSNLELREVLRAIAANIREVMHCDMVGITLPDAPSGRFLLYALDFPQGGGKGVLQEETLFTPGTAAKRALEDLTPVLVNISDREEFPPEVYEQFVAEGLRYHCVIPLVNRGRALGLMAIVRKTKAFLPEDVEFLGQTAGQIAIAIENSLAYQEISDLRDKLAQEKLYLEEEIRSEMGFEQIIGSSTALKHVLELVNTVAPSDSTVLLLGETGTGKELIARAIHEHSRRKERTFVKLNCAAIPTGLLESELFGHEKGAFTGAISQKIGRLELADRGSLFLDEVGDIPVEIQPKLLRALQEREFERLGSTQTRKVNIRLVAATNRDLEQMISAREFRSDLYYRLNVFPIRIPPLRERREDIPLLVSYFVQKFSKQMQKNIEAIPAAVMKGLTAWDWPGNIRELENFIERAVILTRGKSLEAPLAELRKTTVEGPKRAAQPDKNDIAQIVKETIESLNGQKNISDENSRKQREEIVLALTESKGRVGGADGAAARMGINRTTLLSRMKKFGIDPRKYA